MSPEPLELDPGEHLEAPNAIFLNSLNRRPQLDRELHRHHPHDPNTPMLAGLLGPSPLLWGFRGFECTLHNYHIEGPLPGGSVAMLQLHNATQQTPCPSPPSPASGNSTCITAMKAVRCGSLQLLVSSASNRYSVGDAVQRLLFPLWGASASRLLGARRF